MNTEHKSELYTKIKQFIATFQYRSDRGINIELTAMLLDIRHVREYSYDIDENDHYHITLEIKDFSRSAAKEAFAELLDIVDYGDSIIYTRQISKDSITYSLASLTTDGTGFLMEITFIPYKTS